MALLRSSILVMTVPFIGVYRSFSYPLGRGEFIYQEGCDITAERFAGSDIFRSCIIDVNAADTAHCGVEFRCERLCKRTTNRFIFMPRKIEY